MTVQRGDPLPEDDHIVRYVGMSNLKGDGWPHGGAFRRKKAEARPSVNWMDHFSGTRDDQVAAIRKVIHLKPGANAKFAELCIGDLIALAADKAAAVLQVVSEPSAATTDYPCDPSHAEIGGWPDNEKILCDLLAELVVKLYPARTS